MPIGLIRIDPGDFPAQEMPCLRCGRSALVRFAGPCPDCVAELRATVRGATRTVDATYEPKMNVTPNAVALKDD